MNRTLALVTFLLASLVGTASAQEGIQRGTFKRVDAAKETVTLTRDGKDLDFGVTADTRLMSGDGKPLSLNAFKAGAAVMFKTEERQGKSVLVGLRLNDGNNPRSSRPPLAKVDLSKLKPLDELGAGEYQGFRGGFYPGGKNERPEEHEAAGLARAKRVQPLDAAGKSASGGKIVLLSIGMSNTGQASQGFERALRADTDHNPTVLFVNGAVGGMTASRIQDPGDGKDGEKYWRIVDERLKAAGVAREQVQAIWIKEADAGPSEGFPGYAKKLQKELAKIVQLLPGRFPNLQQVYLSSRTYGGYTTTGLNPEPYAYESAFSVRWLIEDQLKGDPSLNFDPSKGSVKAPWLSWGPYLWAPGETPRKDGFSYDRSDFVKDGTHLSSSGIEKVGRRMLQFFLADSTSRPWFRKQ